MIAFGIARSFWSIKRDGDTKGKLIKMLKTMSTSEECSIMIICEAIQGVIIARQKNEWSNIYLLYKEMVPNKFDVLQNASTEISKIIDVMCVNRPRSQSVSLVPFLTIIKFFSRCVLSNTELSDKVLKLVNELKPKRKDLRLLSEIEDIVVGNVKIVYLK